MPVQGLIDLQEAGRDARARRTTVSVKPSICAIQTVTDSSCIWNRPREEWPRNADGSLAMFTMSLDLDSLLAEH